MPAVVSIGGSAWVLNETDYTFSWVPVDVATSKLSIMSALHVHIMFDGGTAGQNRSGQDGSIFSLKQ